MPDKDLIHTEGAMGYEPTALAARWSWAAGLGPAHLSSGKARMGPGPGCSGGRSSSTGHARGLTLSGHVFRPLLRGPGRRVTCGVPAAWDPCGEGTGHGSETAGLLNLSASRQSLEHGERAPVGPFSVKRVLARPSRSNGSSCRGYSGT